MPSPSGGYILDGVRLPSVTTITGRFKDSGRLMFWAFNQGKSGASELYEQSQKAADIGSVAHAMVESWVHGRMGMVSRPDSMSVQDYAKAEGAFETYLTWERQTSLRILETEVSLISRKHRFGGTLDAVGEIDGKLCLPDWKTSNAIYPEMLTQLGGYAILWEENFPERPLVGGFHSVRFSKDFGDFGHRYFPELNDARRLFLLLREAYDLDKALGKRAA